MGNCPTFVSGITEPQTNQKEKGPEKKGGDGKKWDGIINPIDGGGRGRVVRVSKD